MKAMEARVKAVIAKNTPAVVSLMGESVPGAGSGTVVSADGVILTAAYMLSMIQKIFYGNLGLKSRSVAAPDLDAREHLALWPVMLVMLAMGLASPVWMQAIDTAGVALAQVSPASPSKAASNIYLVPGSNFPQGKLLSGGQR